jgi:hypothetical protein
MKKINMEELIILFKEETVTTELRFVNGHQPEYEGAPYGTAIKVLQQKVRVDIQYKCGESCLEFVWRDVPTVVEDLT